MNTRWSVIATLILAPLLAVADSPATPSFDVKKYGAIGDGTTMDTDALQKVIDAAANAGGGTVVFSPGRYLSGSLDLKSHVTLRLEENASLLGSPHHPD